MMRLNCLNCCHCFSFTPFFSPYELPMSKFFYPLTSDYLQYFFLDRPGAPGQPEAVATTDDTITLQWDRPISDGGSPIQGYVLEKREEGTPEWSKCAFGTISDTRYKVYSPSITSLFAVVSFATVPLKIISHSKMTSSSERLNEKKASRVFNIAYRSRLF